MYHYFSHIFFFSLLFFLISISVSALLPRLITNWPFHHRGWFPLLVHVITATDMQLTLSLPSIYLVHIHLFCIRREGRRVIVRTNASEIVYVSCLVLRYCSCSHCRFSQYRSRRQMRAKELHFPLYVNKNTSGTMKQKRKIPHLFTIFLSIGEYNTLGFPTHLSRSFTSSPFLRPMKQ